MKKIFKIKGMHCNSCASLIHNSLKDRVNSISVSYAKEQAEIDFDENKISEDEIKSKIEKAGYSIADNSKKDYTPFFILGGTFLLILTALYITFGSSIDFSGVRLPEIGQNASLILLFFVGLLTGFHCVSMCGGFVVSYTAKNAVNGNTGFGQHLVYGGSKVVSYTIVGALFGLIGGIFAFSIALRGWVAIIAGIFMIFYAFSMFGFSFFRRFQFNPKFLTSAASSVGKYAKGPYRAPMITGLLNGLFIACGPLQAMYLYAAGTGSAVSGALSLAAFGLGTLPVMLGFGSIASIISHNTTRKILKFSAIIVLILGMIMLNRGLALTGSSFSIDSVKNSILGIGGTGAVNFANNNVVVVNGVQEVSMDVDSSGYSPSSFVLKVGVPVKWKVNVKQLTGCNEELVMNAYGIDKHLQTGLNIIEFTPAKVGTISFTCGMGMLRGSFIVTENGQATQAQITGAATKSSSGSTCGMSSGSCGCGGMKR